VVFNLPAVVQQPVARVETRRQVRMGESERGEGAVTMIYHTLSRCVAVSPALPVVCNASLLLLSRSPEPVYGETTQSAILPGLYFDFIEVVLKTIPCREYFSL
jgi:hypothetical protein